jgi:hypothetical protein
MSKSQSRRVSALAALGAQGPESDLASGGWRLSRDLTEGVLKQQPTA